MRTRVKICGLTRARDALAAVACGADAVGLVFYPPSPRAVSIAQARHVVSALPPFVTVVGLFVDAQPAEIRKVLEQVRIDLLQFHGNEPPQACGGYDRPWIKAVRMRDGTDVAAIKSRYEAASGLLLDSYRPGEPGGTGERFDWKRIPRELAGGMVLAGGLRPGNIAAAVREVRPYAVDVSGGVEKSPGIKDPDKMTAFLRGVRRADDHARFHAFP